MGLTAAMALICYISSNPSPQQWLVSGSSEAVARMDMAAAATDEVRRIAHADDADTGFSRYELAANPPNRVLWILLRAAEQDRMIYSRFQHVVPSCPSGQRGDVGNSRSDLVIALIGSPAAIRKLRLPPGVGEEPVRLDDGRTGIGFALRDADRDHYDELVRRAAAGMLPGVDLVLIRPPGETPTAPADPNSRIPLRPGLNHGER